MGLCFLFFCSLRLFYVVAFSIMRADIPLSIGLVNYKLNAEYRLYLDNRSIIVQE